MQIIIDTANTAVTVKNQCFFIQNESVARQISPKRITSIAITSDCTLNAAAIKLAANHQVPIFFFDPLGNIQAKLWSPYFVNLAGLRKKQLLFSMSNHATDWVISNLAKKTEEQVKNLNRLAEQRPRHKEAVKAAAAKIQEIFTGTNALKSKKLNEARNILMGHEGSISRIYFETINLFLPEDFQFESRSRRPALDHFNAGLNYLYGMTYSVVEGGVFAKGLDPFTGFLHADNYTEPTLVFDLIEPVRPLIDRLLLTMILENKLLPKHFIPKDGGFWVGKEGKRIVIEAFNSHMQDRLEFNGSVKRLKDHIYWESNELGDLIDHQIQLP